MKNAVTAKSTVMASGVSKLLLAGVSVVAKIAQTLTPPNSHSGDETCLPQPEFDG
jgi:hypothetical protein